MNWKPLPTAFAGWSASQRKDLECPSVADRRFALTNKIGWVWRPLDPL